MEDSKQQHTMNPEDYFKPGSEGYTQTRQALDVINAGREAGLPDMDQYEQDLEASISLAKQSGWKQWKGFDATRQAISGLAPQVNAVAQQRNSTKNVVSQIEGSLNLIGSSGMEFPPEQLAAIRAAAEQGDSATLETYNTALKARTAALIETQLPRTEAEQAKINVDLEKAEEIKQKRFSEQEDARQSKLFAEEELKSKYKTLVTLKEDPLIGSAFGVPIERLVPGFEASSLSAKVEQLADQAWIDAIIKSKNAGATFGSLTEREGTRLASAATLLAKPYRLNYKTANEELQKMTESVKKLYRASSGRSIKDDLGIETETPPDKMTPEQIADKTAKTNREVLEGAQPK